MSNQKVRRRIKDKMDAKTAVAMISLKDKLQLFKGLKSKNAWAGFFRGSPAEFGSIDGEIIANAIKDAVKNPIEMDYDERKYRRRTKTYESKIGPATVPEDKEDDNKRPQLERRPMKRFNCYR